MWQYMVRRKGSFKGEILCLLVVVPNSENFGDRSGRNPSAVIDALAMQGYLALMRARDAPKTVLGEASRGLTSFSGLPLVANVSVLQNMTVWMHISVQLPATIRWQLDISNERIRL